MSMDLNANDLLAIQSFCASLARRAGALILEGSAALHANPSSSVDEKKNSVDLVTEYDVRVEKLVQGELMKQYPKFALYVRYFCYV
jgi:myo-inositol-1(or 4)-monophosphatase